ncbi:MAG: glycosyltransferase family 2 protein [Syntrophaceae bacterium]|nr:glycosyltransferase family 2 protein [Syntrophaceae bacterium]
MVSVVVPTYNRAHYLGEAIDSILRQDIVDCELEIIVVDDGSKDNTAEIVRSYGTHVRYIRQENQGAGVARNRGIEEARGEWIAFLDSDDRWLSYKLSLQFKVLEHFPGINVIHSNFYTFDGDRIIIPRGLDYWVTSIRGGKTIDWSDAYSRKYRASEFGINLYGKDFDIYSGNIFASLLHASYGACWTMLIHRSCLKEHIRFAANFPTWEDYWFLCKLAECNDIVFVDVATAENRGHKGLRLTTRTDFIDPLLCHCEIIKHIFMMSKSPYKPDDQAILAKCVQIHTWLLREYLKKGDLTAAKQARIAISEMGGVPSNAADWLYRLISYLPFNVVSHLVSAKRRIIGC